MSSDATRNISLTLQDVASGINDVLTDIAGEKVGFSLFVWTEERAQYISNSEREQCAAAIREILDGWDNGMPDIPAHEIA